MKGKNIARFLSNSSFLFFIKYIFSDTVVQVVLTFTSVFVSARAAFKVAGQPLATRITKYFYKLNTRSHTGEGSIPALASIGPQPLDKVFPTRGGKPLPDRRLGSVNFSKKDWYQ